MSDVFISYSQQAKQSTVDLAAALVSRGYDPWYDVNLLPGQAFGRVIDTEIDNAKAVISIWSRPALTSNWVAAESERAWSQGKLISVLGPDVVATELPTPFNRVHAVPVSDIGSITGALAAKGVRPLGSSVSALPAEHRVLAEAAVAWQGLKEAGGIAEIEAFLVRYYAAALYRELAQARLAALQHKTVPPPARPIMPEDVQLRIEPGMHTAVIRRLSLTADERLMATASHDKTVRLWALPEGRLMRTLRPPIGPGNDGKVYSVALAPDGQWAAAGGWGQNDGNHSVYIFETATGAVRARLGPLPNVITDLEVSPDGRRLAAAMYGKNGIRVWQTKSLPASESARGGMSWRLAFEDVDYGGDIYGLSFAGDGRLAVCSYDGFIRLYGSDGRLITKAKAPSGRNPSGVAFSPDGARLAVGYDDTNRVDVISAATLAPLFTPAPDASGVSKGALGSVAWSTDGTRLAATGGYVAYDRRPIVVWADGGRGASAHLPGYPNAVDLAAWDNGLVFSAHDPAFGLHDGVGRPVLHRGPPMANLRGKLHEHFLVSDDGRRVRFGLGEGSAAPVLIDLAGPSLVPSPMAPIDLHASDISSLTVDGWKNTTAPTVSVRSWFRWRKVPLPLEPYERARSLAIAPGAQTFILGTEWRLHNLDATGKSHWHRPVPGVVWGVNLAREGRLVVAAYGDGTIRWHRAADGAELLACFIHVDWSGDEPRSLGWVVWTPKGHYTCSPGSQDLIGWHVNRGPDQAADFYPASTFASTFLKPEVIAIALDEV